ncbi:MAG: type II toxin-antitoxin system RelB/DinJ family antitoxin [Azoarcus sp.]|jgi:DNA-damage-inducible protein J|nr:type II toxin-antitoxin system RelB/DinJ family antitoxin [Azoarcus sp.]
MATIQVRVDENIKTAVDALFSSLGLDTSTAVRMFLAASLERAGLPFAVRRREPAATKKASSRTAMFGCLRGQYEVPDDFDAPLKDFDEYMQ